LSAGHRFRRGLLWGLLVGVLLALAAATAVTRWWAPRPAPLPVLGAVPEFHLVNRDGRAVARQDLAGAPWIVDLVFTRCVLICPLMTTRMAALDRELPGAGDGAGRAVRLVSVTVDPEHDRPEVLEEFARKYRASDRWLFLTGERDEIYRLAGEGLRLGYDPNPPLVPLAPGDDIYHSAKLVLVDAQARVRGYYDSQDAEELALLRRDLARLLDEEG
jgi:cytochrome oxidase Cu insertion factor (SCO1/SenC/PrrC family)